MGVLSPRAADAAARFAAAQEFFLGERYGERRRGADICDFTFRTRKSIPCSRRH